MRNLLDNLGEPVTAINEVFQGDPSRAGVTLARFVVNSTIGLAGLFDVAAMMGMPRTKTDAGQTIGIWAGKGVEPENGGFYIVLPLIGRLKMTVLDIPLLTRDTHRYRAYFPTLRLVTPRPHVG